MEKAKTQSGRVYLPTLCVFSKDLPSRRPPDGKGVNLYIKERSASLSSKVGVFPKIYP